MVHSTGLFVTVRIAQIRKRKRWLVMIGAVNESGAITAGERAE
jgi:hypothetical protein